MNFPHKSLTKTSTETDAVTDKAHHAFLAHAITRQSLTASARAYVMCGGIIDKDEQRNRANRVEDRIRFFAGLPFDRKTNEREHVFQKGHFRPDLADDIILGGAK